MMFRYFDSVGRSGVTCMGSQLLLQAPSSWISDVLFMAFLLKVIMYVFGRMNHLFQCV